MSSIDIAIKLSDVDFSYGRKSIFKKLNLSIKRGYVTAIMGGSGSGKTTILRMVSGQVRPQNGLVQLDSAIVTSASRRELMDLRQKMGMLFQFGALFTDLSVFENVAFPIRERFKLPESAVRDLVLMKLHAVGLRGTASMMPSELSGGMARRVALARTIALDPEFIFYDEPFTGLDPISTSVTGSLIRKLNNALGATSVFVTHDIKASFKIADEVVIISGGRVVVQGSPEELYDSEDPYVRQFVQGESDGLVPFHIPAADYREDIDLQNITDL